MRRKFLIAGCLAACLVPWACASVAAPNSEGNAEGDHGLRIEVLRQEFLSAKNPALRGRILRQLRAVGRDASDASILQSAMESMLPAAESASEAQQLLSIAAANPARGCGEPYDAAADRPFLLDARRLARQEAKQDSKREGDVEALADIRIDRLRVADPGGNVVAESHIQQIWRINTAAGARSFASRQLMYAAMSQRLCVVHARVLRPNGKWTKAVVSADRPVEERAASMYFDSRTRQLSFSHLAPGDLVEIEYRLLPASNVNPWAGYYARMEPFRDGFWTGLRRRVLIAPASLPLYAVEHGVAPPQVQTRRGETTRIWEMHEVPPLVSEALSPGASSMGPYLHVSTIGSLEQFGGWYRGLLEPALKMDPKLRALAGRIRRQNPTLEGRVRAVYESVQRDTRYLAFEFGVHSYQPYPLATIERRGFGDCKDKAALMVALLRATGVEADFAMVRTRSAGKVAANAYSVQLFNHALAYVPALHLYLDGTVEYASPGELPPDDQGATAITVSADGTLTRRRIPFAPPEANRISRRVQATLSADGVLHFVSHVSYTGYRAAVERRRSLEGDLAGSSRLALERFYPSVRIEHAVTEDGTAASQEVDLRLEGELDAAGAPMLAEGRHPDGSHPVSAGGGAAAFHASGQIPDKQGLRAEAVGFTGGETGRVPDFQPAAKVASQREARLRSSYSSATLTESYAPTIERRNPLLIPAVPNVQEDFEYQLPPGAVPLLPPNTFLQSRYGHVEVSYWLDGDSLRVETYTELTPRTIQPGDYPAFRAFCRAADQALRREVRVVLP